MKYSNLYPLALLAWALLFVPASVGAICDVISQPEEAFRADVGAVNRVYASEGDTVLLTQDLAGREAAVPAFSPEPATRRSRRREG